MWGEMCLCHVSYGPILHMWCLLRWSLGSFVWHDPGDVGQLLAFAISKDRACHQKGPSLPPKPIQPDDVQLANRDLIVEQQRLAGLLPSCGIVCESLLWCCPINLWRVKSQRIRILARRSLPQRHSAGDEQHLCKRRDEKARQKRHESWPLRCGLHLMPYFVGFTQVDAWLDVVKRLRWKSVLALRTAMHPSAGSCSSKFSVTVHRSLWDFCGTGAKPALPVLLQDEGLGCPSISGHAICFGDDILCEGADSQFIFAGWRRPALPFFWHPVSIGKEPWEMAGEWADAAYCEGACCGAGVVGQRIRRPKLQFVGMLVRSQKSN